MLDEATLTDHWLVRAITGFGDGNWELAFDGSDTVVFLLADAKSSEWPATLQILRVEDSDWPSETTFSQMRNGVSVDSDKAAEGESEEAVDATIRLSHSNAPAQALTFFDLRVIGGLPGSPLQAEMWIDVAPRLHLVATAAGADLYPLGRMVDSLSELLSGIRPGVDAGPTAGAPREHLDGA